MKDKTDLIFELVKDIDSKQDKQSQSLIRVEADLAYHIKRTDLLENRTEFLVTWKQFGLILTVVGTMVGILKTTGVI